MNTISLLDFFKKHKLIALFCIVAFLLILTSLLQPTQQQKSTSPNLPNPTQVELQKRIEQKNLAVVGTDPANGAQNVSTTEPIITINLNQQIQQKDDIKLTLDPSPPYYLATVNAFPESEIQIKDFGGLTPSTTYKATITKKDGTVIYSWQFTTEDQPAQSSSALVQQQEQKTIHDLYPLANYIPYDTDNFSVDYSGPLTLEVDIGASDNGQTPPLDTIKQQVNDWIRSHGVDPSTHTVNYVTPQVTFSNQ